MSNSCKISLNSREWIATAPKRVDEFVNTWSVEGFYEEGIAPSELGWGTHERWLPPGTDPYDYANLQSACLRHHQIKTHAESMRGRRRARG